MSLIKVSDDQINTLCKIKQGSICCSFLIMSTDGFCCAKGSDMELMIMERREEKSMRAMGDNCYGPPDFTPKENIEE